MTHLPLCKVRLNPGKKLLFVILKGRPNKNQPAPIPAGANNFRPRNSKYCKGLSNRFSFTPSSVLPSCYKSRSIRNSVDWCRSPGTVKERSYSGGQPFRRRLLQLPFFCSEVKRDWQTCNRLSSLNRFVRNSHFQMENLHCLKTLLRSTWQVLI